MIVRVNPFVHLYRQCYSILREPNNNYTIYLKADVPGRTYNIPTMDELAVIIPNTSDNGSSSRDIQIRLTSGQIQRIDSDHISYLPLQYALLFPYGEAGWSHSSHLTTSNRTVTARQFFRYMLHVRNDFYHIFLASKLFQQFIVDCYVILEQNDLKWIRLNQQQLRVESYQGSNFIESQLNTSN
jgi:hypothetical protein